MTWRELLTAVAGTFPFDAVDVIVTSSAPSQGSASDVTSVAYDSRQVVSGSVFVALRGVHADGAAFARDAVARGAVAVVSEAAAPAGHRVAWLQVSDARLAMAALASALFRHPSDALTLVGITGTNGKTTTVQMLAAMLRAAGARAVAAGNVGLALLDAVLADDPYDVIAVELSSFQLHWTHSLRPFAAAVLNLAPDHIDWHGSYAAYAAAKGRIYDRCQVACVYNAGDPSTEELVRTARAEDGCLAVGFTLGVPGVGLLGVVDDVLIDRAFLPERSLHAAELASVSDVRPLAPHNVENALAAAALARAYGASPAAVREGLRSFVPDAHRIARVARLHEVDWVDDSKATNPHAASASLRAFSSVVWIAGGLAKGADFDDVVTAAAGRLRGVVLIGRDRADVAAALARHAPDVPVVEVARTDTGAMDDVVRAAASLAGPGDTVLLAPACASMDMFLSYAHRGEVFAAAVQDLAAAVDPRGPTQSSRPMQTSPPEARP